MNITNESNITLPKELQKAVEAAKNTLTVTEQETKRLITLAKDQESIVRGLLEKKAIADQEATAADESLARIKAEEVALTKQLAEKKEQLKAVEASLKEAVALQGSFQEAKDALRKLINDLV